MDDSMRLLLQRYAHFISQYELLISQNNLKAIRVIEKQLAYLVQATVSFFSYGMPSGVNKQSFFIKTTTFDDAENLQAPKEKIKPEFLDF